MDITKVVGLRLYNIPFLFESKRQDPDSKKVDIGDGLIRIYHDGLCSSYGFIPN